MQIKIVFLRFFLIEIKLIHIFYLFSQIIFFINNKMKSNELSPEDVLQLFQEAMRSEIYADNQSNHNYFFKELQIVLYYSSVSELYGRLNSVLLIVPHIVKERLQFYFLYSAIIFVLGLAQFDTMIFQDKKQYGFTFSLIFNDYIFILFRISQDV